MNKDKIKFKENSIFFNMFAGFLTFFVIVHSYTLADSLAFRVGNMYMDFFVIVLFSLLIPYLIVHMWSKNFINENDMRSEKAINLFKMLFFTLTFMNFLDFYAKKLPSDGVFIQFKVIELIIVFLITARMLKKLRMLKQTPKIREEKNDNKR